MSVFDGTAFEQCNVDSDSEMNNYRLRADRQWIGHYEGETPREAYINYAKDVSVPSAIVSICPEDCEEMIGNAIETFYARQFTFKKSWFDGRPPKHPRNSFSVELDYE